MVFEVSNTEDPNEGWELIIPADVPEWVKEPDVLGKLEEGQAVCFDPDGGGRWYRTSHVPEPEEVEVYC